MLAKLWSGENRCYRLLLPFSWLYGSIVLLRRKLYQWSMLKSWKAPVPVVVVGNLTVGGNGKTPLVIWLIEQLQQQGLRVGVVSRGYGSLAKKFPLHIDASTTPEQGGDEPVLIFQRTGAPVVISPNRVEAVKTLLSVASIDLIITDDGLQHYALQRDFEIVVVDSQRLFGNGWWLPAGPMRERQSRLKSVDKMVMNGTQNTLTDALTMTLKAEHAINLVTGQTISVKNLSNIVGMAGIGYPPRFFETVTSLGGKLQKTQAFDDHHQYQYHEIKPLVNAEQNLLMTEKDAVKCRAFAEPNWWYLPIDATFSPEQTQQLVQPIVQLVSTHKQHTAGSL